MERPSVQAPDTFYPEAGSHMPLYAAAVKNQRGPSFPCSALFLRGKAFIRPAPAPTTEVLKNMEERLILLFVCGTVHLPGSAPPAFSSPSLQPLFIMGEKTGVRAKEKACFRTVQDKFQGFRPVVLDLRQKYARLSLSH